MHYIYNFSYSYSLRFFIRDLIINDICKITHTSDRVLDCCRWQWSRVLAPLVLQPTQLLFVNGYLGKPIGVVEMVDGGF